MGKLLGPPGSRARTCVWTGATLLALAVLAFAPASARAQLLDPSTLQIGSSTSGGLDPVQLGTGVTTVTVTNVSNGAGDLNTPWYLILGLVNASSDSVKISAINGTPVTPYGFSFSATMGAGQEAYSQLGLDAGTNNSNSFVNWSGAELSIDGIPATSFGLFAYQINPTLSGGGTDSITFNSSLPVGTFVIAYGTTGIPPSKAFDTPFTEAGLTTGQNHPVPVPSSMVLALTGFASFGLVKLRYLRRKLVGAAV